MIITVDQGEGRIHALVTPEAFCEICEEEGLVNHYDQAVIFGALRDLPIAVECPCIITQLDRMRGVTDYEIVGKEHKLAPLLKQLGDWQEQQLDAEEQKRKAEFDLDRHIELQPPQRPQILWLAESDERKI